MILGINLEKAISIVGHQRGSKNSELISALGSYAKTTKSIRISGNPLDPSILRIKGQTGRHHVVLLHDRLIYDPGVPRFVPYYAWEHWVLGRGWRIVSQIPLHSNSPGFKLTNLG